MSEKSRGGGRASPAYNPEKITVNFRAKLRDLIADAVAEGASSDEVEKAVRDVVFGGDPDAYPDLSFPDDLVKAHERLKYADRHFDDEWSSFLKNVLPLGEARFWELVPRLRREIEGYLWELDRSDGVELACEEFFRLAGSGQADYSYDEALGFVARYGVFTRHVEDRVVDRHGWHGDSYNDFVDSSPLLGAKALANGGDLDVEAMRASEPDERWRKFIFEGENYVETNLIEAAKNHLGTRLNNRGTAE